jgi:hypothetical protein
MSKKRKEKFTPGPWFAAGDRVWNGQTERTESGWRIHGKNSMQVCDCDDMDIEDDDVKEANASLVAAAPELYDFANGFVELFRDSDMRPEDERHELYSKAMSALKKARGE